MGFTRILAPVTALASVWVLSCACGSAAAAAEETAPQANVDLGQVFSEAMERHQAGDFAGAAALYEKIVREAPDASLVRSNLGAVYARLGRYSEAIVQYREALLPKDNPAIRYNLAIALQRAGQIREAAAEAARVADASPGNRDVILLLASCHAQMGEFEKVVERLRPLSSRPAGDKAVAHLLGTALLELNRTAEAEAVLDPLFRDDTPEARVLVASMHVKRNDWARARQELEKARSAKPDLPLANFLYGVSVMNELSDWAGAAAAFRKELEVNPNHFEANLLLANLLRQGGQHAEALPYVERAARLRADDLGVKYSLGAIYVSLGRLEEARPLLEAVAAAFPDHIPTHTQLAILFARLGLEAESRREREIVARLGKASEAKAFDDVRESLPGRLGKQKP